MKKQLVLTGLVGSLVAFGALSAQAFTSVQTAVVTAAATTAGTKTASFTLSLHPVASTATTATQIGWSGALPGGTWKIADQVMQLIWNVTDIAGGIQIYTDNNNAASNPRFVDPTPADNTNSDSNPAGLVMVGNTSQVLPVAWSIKTGTATVGGNLVPADPTNTLDLNSFQWLYMADKNTPAIPSTNTSAFVNADPFVTAIKQSGVHGAQGPTQFFADPDKHSFVYMQANFATAAAQSSYQTNRLTVEAFIQ